MARKRTKQDRCVQGVSPMDDPRALSNLVERFLKWMEVTNYSDMSVVARRFGLGLFVRWCDERSIVHANEVTRAILDRYRRYLHHYRKKDGKPLSVSSKYSRLTSLRLFFRWLAKNNHVLHNPALDLELPRPEYRLPTNTFTIEEVEQVLAQADITNPFGLRDRAIMETLYSTGLRRMELCNLMVYDLNATNGTVMVRQGKGKKDRVVPIGDRALQWVEKYLADARPMLSRSLDDGPLFVTKTGKAMRRDRLTQLCRDYVQRAGINKGGACHAFRHTCATLMLEGGADVRYIQAQLGHVQLSSTQIYTQVSVTKLKEVHTRTHPAGVEGTKEKSDV